MKIRIKDQQEEREPELVLWLEPKTEGRGVYLMGTADKRHKRTVLRIDEEGIFRYGGCKSMGLSTDQAGHVRVVDQADPHPATGPWVKGNTPDEEGWYVLRREEKSGLSVLMWQDGEWRWADSVPVINARVTHYAKVNE